MKYFSPGNAQKSSAALKVQRYSSNSPNTSDRKDASARFESELASLCDDAKSNNCNGFLIQSNKLCCLLMYLTTYPIFINTHIVTSSIIFICVCSRSLLLSYHKLKPPELPCVPALHVNHLVKSNSVYDNSIPQYSTIIETLERIILFMFQFSRDIIILIVAAPNTKTDLAKQIKRNKQNEKKAILTVCVMWSSKV